MLLSALLNLLQKEEIYQSTDSNVNLIQKHPHRLTQYNIWPSVWVTHGPIKLTHKINHHRDQESGNGVEVFAPSSPLTKIPRQIS